MKATYLLGLEMVLHLAAAGDTAGLASRESVFGQMYMGTKSDVFSELAAGRVNDSGVYTLPLVRQGPDIYYATIQLGSPPQDLTVGLDTGSANLWVPSLRCDPLVCRQHNRYNSTASSTYRPNGTEFEIGYGVNSSSEHGSSISGFVSQDTLTIVGLRIEGQDFAEAMNGSNMEYMEAHGVFGLGFDIAAVNYMVPPFYHMMARRFLKEPLLAFYFSALENHVGSSSEATFGGVNEDHYDGELIKLPVRRYGTWEVTIDKISLGNETIELSDAGASIDTGMGLIGLPSAVARILNTKMGATELPGAEYTIACDKRASLPDLTFTLGGYDFIITPNEYIFDEEDRCMSALMGEDFDEHGLTAVLGLTFLRKWYSVFDFGDTTISFARARR